MYLKNFKHLDRAICDSTTDGFVKILTKAGTDKILGATIVGPQAGDLIGQISVAMANKLGKPPHIMHRSWRSWEGYIPVPYVCGVVPSSGGSVATQEVDTEDKSVPARHH